MRPHRCNNNNNNNNTCWLRVLFLAGLTLLLYIQLFVGAIVKELGALSMVDRSSIVNNNNNVKNEMRNNPSSHTPVETFICPVTTETTTPMTATTLSPHGYTPIVVFSDPRTGSNLLFSFLRRFRYVVTSSEFDQLNLVELFLETTTGELEFRQFVAITEAIVRGCQYQWTELETISTGTHSTTNSTPSGTIASRYVSDVEPPLITYLATRYPHITTLEQLTQLLRQVLPEAQFATIQKAFHLMQERFRQPLQYIDFLCRIPSRARKAYLIFKVFEKQMDRIHSNVTAFVQALQQQQRQHNQSPPTPRALYWVLWRRRMIESYVSLLIAAQKGRYLDSNTTVRDSIFISKSTWEMYWHSKRKYYQTIRSTLESWNLPYTVFEYDRDLVTPSQQWTTVQRVKTLLNLSLPEEQTTYEIFLGQVTVTKQRTIPVSALVRNWDEVQEWGYGGESHEWEDLFGKKDN